ncbi:Fpg/Nei family DNA glycosylase [Streptomyces oceani]|uniref:Formamidopyrimidine-DNA glycosylase n=1 Tax=Streptomyces oceani TaxID=1075402 RepID=A0A1E7KKG1_9ACTN|nr:DNA-formamidopyrimidine glycosylase family protein [Streptomyces oceani]OEV04374.1 formamidopyrimidine-DNA glycosylase [Streptomyces oceani]
MPELPDVEEFRRVLDSCGRRRSIRRVDVRDGGVLHDMSPRRFSRALEGRRFTEPVRHGKLLLARTGGPTVLLHFGMTGQLVCDTDEDPEHPHDRVVFVLGGGRRLRYRDQRKLRGLWLLGEKEETEWLRSQGPDAASAGRAEVRAALRGSRAGVKSALMDQTVLAGLGNLLADEVLWRSRLDPRRSVALLSDEDHRRLYAALHGTLGPAIRAGRVPPRGNWITGHRDDPAGECPRCGHRLEHARVAGRGTVWCPLCQPALS